MTSLTELATYRLSQTVCMTVPEVTCVKLKAGYCKHENKLGFLDYIVLMGGSLTVKVKENKEEVGNIITST